MKLRKTRHFPGLRIVKTALAVALSVLLAQLLTQEPLSLFYAAFGALIAMETTVSRALRQGLTQLVGVVCGTLLGYASVLLFPPPAPFWVIGLGVFLLLFLLNALRLNFSASLACVIFLSSCVVPTANVVGDSVRRLLCTAIGLVTALAVNVCIRPYNNRRRILLLLDKLRQRVPEAAASVVDARIPELQPLVALLRSLDAELELYHAQRFLRRQDDEAVLSGCGQLAQRMVQELEVICGMDALGELNETNARRLQALGVGLPDKPPARRCDPNDTIVMNYHLDKLLTAYDFLTELMRE